MRKNNRLQHHVLFCPKADRSIGGSEAEYCTVDFLVTNLSTEDVGDYRMLVNYNLPIGSGSREIDIVLIDRFGVFLLEVKGWVGHIEARDDYWLVDDIQKRKNALEDIHGKARPFHEKFFGRKGELNYLQEVNVTGIVVLTQGLGRFENASGRNTDVVVGLDNQLIHLLRTEEALHYGSRGRNLSDIDIHRVYETIIGKHQAKREEIVENYRILGELSFGDLFDAYEAQNILVENHHVRLKRYQLPTMSQPNRQFDILQFKRSVDAVASMGPHNNILSSLNFFSDERPDVFYEVTELIAPGGGRLDEIIARTKRPIPLDEQLSYLRQICHALEFAHSHNIYHRNICPETIFVTKEKVVKLGDFDFAKYGQYTINPQMRKMPMPQGQVLIEKDYTAPELLYNASDASPASDIYALGVLWWELANIPQKKSKFQAEYAKDLIDAIPQPDAVKTLMKRMVAYDPEDRPQAISEIIREFDLMGQHKEHIENIDNYLHINVKNVEDPLPTSKQVAHEEDKKTDTQCSLILDYENMVLQLGTLGYFPTQNEIDQHLVTLQLNAQDRYAKYDAGSIEGLAVGHWERPDLSAIARHLENHLYKLVHVPTGESTSTVIIRELMRRTEQQYPTRQFLVVAPDNELVPSIKSFTDRENTVHVWVSEAPETSIYRVAVRGEVQSLPKMLGLISTPDTFDANLEQAACILHLGEKTSGDKGGFSLDEFNALLRQIESIKERVDWWRLRLLHQHVVISVVTDRTHYFKLNADHPNLSAVREKRNAVIRTLQDLLAVENCQGIEQDTLLNELHRLASFRTSRHDNPAIIAFLVLLKNEDILHLDPRSFAPDMQPLWHLNPKHWAIVQVNKELYLPLLLLGIDHFLVQEGFPFIHQHAIKNKLASYIDRAISDTVYQMALQQNWLIAKKTDRTLPHSKEHVINVSLADGKEEVKEILRCRDIIITELYYKAASTGIDRNVLWATVKKNRHYTLKSRDEFNRWLEIFQREAVITIEHHQSDKQKDHIKLRLDSRLGQGLLGRIYLYRLVQILRTAQVNGSITINDLIERLSRKIIYGNKSLANWTLDYARCVRLVEVINESKNASARVYLKQQHNYITKLDQNERGTCIALTELIRMLSQNHFDGELVPQHVLMQEMEKDYRYGFSQDKYDYLIQQTVHRYHIEVMWESSSTMPLSDFQLDTLWDSYLDQVKITTSQFWAHYSNHDYARVQNEKVWLQVRYRLTAIMENLPGVSQLTDFETFLLHAAAYLYEVGWQSADAKSLSATKRNTASGYMIRASLASNTTNLEFGLSSLDPATVDILARICESVALTDLESLPGEPLSTGYHETVRLRYLVALLQLADMLVIDRAKTEHFRKLSFLSLDNCSDARIALYKNAEFVLTDEGLNTHLRVHTIDETYIPKMKALLLEPIQRWYAANCHWLYTDFHFFLKLNTPTVDLRAQEWERLERTCKALLPFLRTYEPYILQLPTDPAEFSALSKETTKEVTLSSANTKRTPKYTLGNTTPIYPRGMTPAGDLGSASFMIQDVVDIGIVFARSEDFRELFNEIAPRCQAFHDADRNYYYVFRHEDPVTLRHYHAVATFIGENSQLKAGLMTQRLVSEWLPRTLVMLGVAAALNHEVRLGDIVIASQVDAYLENSRVIDTAGQTYTFELSGDVYRCSPDLLHFSRHFEFVHSPVFQAWQKHSMSEIRQLLSTEQIDNLLQSGLVADKIQIRDGHLASGPTFGASQYFGNWLKTRDRSYLALETEAAGLMTAAHSVTSDRRTMILRAISNYGDERKGQLDHIDHGILRRYAIGNAIQLLWKFLDLGIFPHEGGSG